MKEKIKNWYNLNNQHPNDNDMFYDIVINSLDSKIDFDEFEEAIVDVNSAYCVYKRYEDLRNCVLLYRKQMIR